MGWSRGEPPERFEAQLEIKLFDKLTANGPVAQRHALTRQRFIRP